MYYSHIILVPNKIITEHGIDSKEVEEHIENVMDYFDENREVVPYNTPCWLCEGSGLQSDGHSICDECDGAKIVETTSNDNGQWVWYSFGGRWNGEIQNNYFGSDDGFNFEDKYRLIENNNISAKKWLSQTKEDRFYPYSYCFDNTWIEKGWSEDDDEEKFIEGFENFIKDNPETHLVLLDVHN